MTILIFLFLPLPLPWHFNNISRTGTTVNNYVFLRIAQEYSILQHPAATSASSSSAPQNTLAANQQMLQQQHSQQQQQQQQQSPLIPGGLVSPLGSQMDILRALGLQSPVVHSKY